MPENQVDTIPEWMSHKYGSGRHLPVDEALGSAVSRAQKLSSELGNGDLGCANEPCGRSSKEAQWAAGRQTSDSEGTQGGRRKSWHWGKCAMPLDFKMVDFAELEDKTRLLHHMQDNWLYQDEVTPKVIEKLENTIPFKDLIEQWWVKHAPQINEKLVPCVKEMMSSSYNESIPLLASFEQTLQQLIDGGSTEQRAWAIIASDISKLRTHDRAGNVSVQNIVFGPRLKGLEFETQDVSFGSFHFSAVDMGKDAKLNLRTQRVLGRENTTERNQCV